MSTKQLTLVLGVLVVLGILVYAGRTVMRNGYISATPSPTPSITPEPVVSIPPGTICTMDAKLCPNGSYVGRTGPNCEFAMCPVGVQEKFPSGVFEAKFGQKAGGGMLTIIPLELIEDSRCPSDVQCIQAGTVRIKADVVYKGATTTQTIKLNTPILYGGVSSVNLTQVLPASISTKKIVKADYRFTFTFIP